MRVKKWVAAAAVLLALPLVTAGKCDGDCHNNVQANGPGKTFTTTQCK